MENFKLKRKPVAPCKIPNYKTVSINNWFEYMNVGNIRAIIKDLPDEASIDFSFEKRRDGYGYGEAIELIVQATIPIPDDGSYDVKMAKYEKDLKEWNAWNKKYADEIKAFKKEQANKRKQKNAKIRKLQKEIDKLRRDA